MTHKYLIFGQCMTTERRFRTPMTLAEASRRPDLHFQFSVNQGNPESVAGSCLYTSPDKNHLGESAVQLYALSEGYLMRFPRVADFTLAPGLIDCRLYDPLLDYMVEVCLLGHVFSYYLELSGIIALHAGAIEMNGRAVLFAAESTGGKSTLVASFVKAGYALLADDISALALSPEGLRCLHGFPQLKLTPDQARRFLGREGDYPLVHPSFEKLSVPLRDLGKPATSPLSVATIYLLSREQEVSGIEEAARITRLPAAEAVIHLVRHSFLSRILESQRGSCEFACDTQTYALNDLRVARFQRLSRIASTVPVKHLHYTNGFERLPDVHRTIVGDIESR